MYEVVGFKAKYSLNSNLQLPNHAFSIKFLLKFNSLILEEYYMNHGLEKELPLYLHYHNVKTYNRYVVVGVEVIGTAEKYHR